MPPLIPNVYTLTVDGLERTAGGGFVVAAGQQALVALNEIIILREQVAGGLWRVMLGYVQNDAQGRRVAWPISDREFNVG